jgi:DNA-binding NarL/FixJ family response regulator
MPPFNGIEAAQKIRNISPDTAIIAVTISNLPAYAKTMFQLGALGYVTKNSSIEEMIEAILTVSRGKMYICAEMKELLSGSVKISGEISAVQQLTRREMEIADLIKTGHSSKDICAKLDISVNTVEAHRYNISRKLKVKNTASLIHYMSSNAVHA